MLNYSTFNENAHITDIARELKDDLRGLGLLLDALAIAPNIEPEQIGLLADNVDLMSKAANALYTSLEHSHTLSK